MFTRHAGLYGMRYVKPDYTPVTVRICCTNRVVSS